MTSVTENGEGRSAQKLVSCQHRRKHYNLQDLDGNGFSGVLQKSPPPIPPALLRKIGMKEIGTGKVKVMLRVNNPLSLASRTDTSYNSFFTLDKRKKQLILTDPSICNGEDSEERRAGVAAPKVFTFDAVFSKDDSQAEICSTVLTDVIPAVINGTDACLFSFGQAGLGKSYTMLGSSASANTIGIIPCAISWLFKVISEQKQRTGARFSVRVSAVEICCLTNELRDLLAGYSNEMEQSPGVYLRDEHLQRNQTPHSELRVSSAEKAALYLDAALECSSSCKEEMKDSHFMFTLHIYQYSVAFKGEVAGGRSRLHLIDLGNEDRSKTNGLGNLILAIFNGQKHLSYKEQKLTQLLKQCLGPVSCHATMIAHVSPSARNYLDTLTTVQLASRIHRMRRRRIKVFSTGIYYSSGGSSGEDAVKTGTSSEPDPSSSDLSADTVIYVGPTDDPTDGEHPPVYIPSLNSGDNRCSMSKILTGSVAEHKLTQTLKPKSEEKIVQRSSGKTVMNLSSVRSSSSRKESSKGKIDATRYFVNDCSDEQWIDGPRISKSRIAEAFQLMKGKCPSRKFETWVDGPLQEKIHTRYGYMDSHKKNMIKKWVQHQTVQIQKTKHFPKFPEFQLRSDFSQQRNKFIDTNEACTSKERVEKSAKFKIPIKVEENDDDDEPELPPALPLIEPLNSREVSLENLDQVLKGRIFSSMEYDNRPKYPPEENCDKVEDLEILEVEEPLEPVPMQDICVQVTEEDIALSMSETENPLPEVDQEPHFYNQRLRNPSEENLSSISLFTDSMSVINKLGQIVPRYIDLNGYYNDYEDIDSSLFQNYDEDKEYYGKAGNDKTSNSDFLKYYNPHNTMKRCGSLTLSDILLCQENERSDESSIYSEPVYLQQRFCENCKINMYRPNTSPNTPFFNSTHNINSISQMDIGEKFRRYIHTERELSQLRQPDGASNPNLETELNRIPGSGACSDIFPDFIKPSLIPKSFLPPEKSKVNSETGLAAIKINSKILRGQKSDEFDSGQDCIPKSSKHHPIETLRLDERGCSPIFRDSNVCSSKSEPNKTSISHRRKNHCRHNHTKSFCSWFINPFTCKYIDEPETHL